jgi:hypothetical protein
MIRDSKIFADGDRKIKERADAKNDFEMLVVPHREETFFVFDPIFSVQVYLYVAQSAE